MAVGFLHHAISHAGLLRKTLVQRGRGDCVLVRGAPSSSSSSRFAYPFFLPPSFAFPSLRMASGHSTDKFSFLYPTDTSQNVKSKNRLSSTMNPVYSPVQPGTPYGNPKNMAYAGYPGVYPTTAPTYTANLYQTGSPGYPPGYTAGTPYKVPPTQNNGAPPPYSPSPNPYQTAMYPIRSAYPQQNLYAQGAYYTQPVYAAQPHVIHHTTVVQPNSIPSAIYPAPVPAPRSNGMAMGMVAGTTMAMSAGTLLTTPQHTQIGAHPVTVPTYRPQGTPGYSYVPPHW
uniref:Family with sequence similarity 168 member A n=1 Tax=Cyprinus carpio carpio TaxID=630221 RepID=A0A9J8ACQ2_CYPCA